MRHFGMQAYLMAGRMFLAFLPAQSAASRDEVKPKKTPPYFEVFLSFRNSPL
jgi:hypothetical protein